MFFVGELRRIRPHFRQKGGGIFVHGRQAAQQFGEWIGNRLARKIHGLDAPFRHYTARALQVLLGKRPA